MKNKKELLAMDESEFITAIYKTGKTPKLIRILDKVLADSADEGTFKRFSLKRFAARLEQNPNKSEPLTLIEKIDLHSALMQDDTNL